MPDAPSYVNRKVKGVEQRILNIDITGRKPNVDLLITRGDVEVVLKIFEGVVVRESSCAPGFRFPFANGTAGGCIGVNRFLAASPKYGW